MTWLLLKLPLCLAAYPVTIVAMRKKTAIVRLKHKTKIGGMYRQAGSEVTVRIDHLTEELPPGCVVSKGRGKFQLSRGAQP